MAHMMGFDPRAGMWALIWDLLDSGALCSMGSKYRCYVLGCRLRVQHSEIGAGTTGTIGSDLDIRGTVKNLDRGAILRVGMCFYTRTLEKKFSYRIHARLAYQKY